MIRFGFMKYQFWINFNKSMDYIGKKKYLIEEMDVKYVIEYILNNFS